jgi:uncharacterized protein YecE (DUF72 family)
MLRVGTSGWDYDAWRRKFYPEKLKKRERLGYYASQFPTVEVNYTFTKVPDEEVFAEWAAQVPDEFVFAIKAPQTITHFKRLVGCRREVERLFKKSAVMQKKRGPFLFQLPPNFKADHRRLKNFLKLIDVPAAFEFRHESWFGDQTFDLLKSANVALCIADTDDLRTPSVKTAPFGYFRLRREDYEKKDLAVWRDETNGFSGDVFVYFKHEDSASGPRFARQLVR